MRHRALVVGTHWPTAAVIVGLALLWSAAAAGAAGPPGGNNGTVKVHDGNAGTTPIVRNEPHVCTFHLHFYFADPVQSGSWQIRDWAPGDKGAVVLSGSYATEPDGVDRAPATGVFGLPDGHYKLSWTGRSDQNLKHKTFWVECAPAPLATPTPTPTPTPTASASASPSGGVSPATATPGPTPSGQELPAVGSAPVTLPPTDAISTAARGGVDAGAAAVLAGLFAAILVLAPTTARRVTG